MKLIRKTVKELEAYETCKIDYRIKLDANEGRNILLKDIDIKDIGLLEDFNINLYPDSQASQLRKSIGEYLGTDADNIIVGNGSSEMIELVMKTYIDPRDIILSFTPSFSMYSLFSKIYSARFVELESNKDFSIDIDSLISKAKDIRPKLVFICNPNNPTGYLIKKEEIIRLLNELECTIVVDEAYMEFAGVSILDDFSDYDNLIILKTFSKALGLAGIRLGYMVSSKKIIKLINKVKSPYNLNAISQLLGIKSLENKNRIQAYIEKVKKERDLLWNEMGKLPLEVFPSHTNFIFFKSNLDKLDEMLKKDGILIRAFKGKLEGYYRVTIGDRYENQEFLKSLKGVLGNEDQ